MGRTVRVLLCAAVALTGFSPAYAATPVKIIDTKAFETSPSVTDGWAAWTASTLAHPNIFHGYVRPDGGAIKQIPVKGDVRTGNIVTDGPHAGQLVLRTRVNFNDDIRFYDLATEQVTKPPSGVNTARDEFSPYVSGNYLVFVRSKASSSGFGDLMLYRFSTGKLAEIASGVYLAEVNGDYVAFGLINSTVRRYQISTRRTKKMPPASGSGRGNYMPAVGADGTMYYVEGSIKYCGRKTKIKRWSHGVVSTVLPATNGIEYNFLQLDTLLGSPTLAYGRYMCPYSSDRAGAYRVNV